MLSREELESAAAKVADDPFAVIDHPKLTEWSEEGCAVVEPADRAGLCCRRPPCDHEEIIRMLICHSNGGQSGGARSAVRHAAGNQRSTIRAPGRSRSGIA